MNIRISLQKRKYCEQKELKQLAFEFYLFNIWLNRTVQGSCFHVLWHQVERMQNVKGQTLTVSADFFLWWISLLCRRTQTHQINRNPNPRSYERAILAIAQRK